MKKLDKKQIPQFVALCILSSGVFGYFVMRMVTPSEAAASTGAHPATAVAGRSPVPATSPTPVNGTAAPAAISSTIAAVSPGPGDPAAVVPPPLPGMRDPFVVGYVDPKIAPAPAAAVAPPALVKVGPQVARANLPGLSGYSGPSVPELPSGLTGFAIRPSHQSPSQSASVAPLAPPPNWIVTGVLQTDTEKMAILRNGEARRIVRSGDFVDSVFRVADVTRNCVVLRSNAATYRLLLGGDKPAGGPALPPDSFGAPRKSAAPPMFTAPAEIEVPPVRLAPARRSNTSGPSLTQAGQALKHLARVWISKAPDQAADTHLPSPPVQVTMGFPDSASE